MMRRNAVAISFMVISTIAAADDPASVPLPDVKIGDTWTFAVVDPISRTEQGEVSTTVLEVTDTSIVAAPDSVFDRQWGIKRLRGVEFSPLEQIYSFPLVAGKKWSHKPAYQYRNCGISTLTLDAEVIGWETVKVPAGTFRALRIDHTGRSSNSCGSPALTRRHWYVPELKMSVKVENLWRGTYSSGGDVFELKAAKVN